MSEIPRSLTNQEKFFVPPTDAIVCGGSRLLVVLFGAVRVVVGGT